VFWENPSLPWNMFREVLSNGRRINPETERESPISKNLHLMQIKFNNL
tara:strand:+ start:180 stop:323 length:144 start_codon:yes stop_codon:yes gene_type:complete